MKLTKIVFRGGVDGIFGESVSSLSTETNPTIRTVRDLEVTLLGLIVTREDGARRWVPLSWCGTGDMADDSGEGFEVEPPGEMLSGSTFEGKQTSGKPRGPRAKAR